MVRTFFDQSVSFNSGIACTIGPDKVHVWGELMKTGLPGFCLPAVFGSVDNDRYCDFYCGF